MKSPLLQAGIMLLTTSAHAQTEPAKDTAPPADTKTKGIAHVRILHAIAGAPAADFYFDDKKFAEKIAFKTVSDYAEVESGKTVIKMTATGKDATLLDATTTFTRGGYYTISPYGTMDKAKLTVQNDETAKSDGKKARLRVFHLAPGLPQADVSFVSPFFGEVPSSAINNVDYGEDSTKLIPPCEATLQLRVGKKFGLDLPRLALEAGKRYAIFIVGKPGVTGVQSLEIIVRPMGAPKE